MLLETKKVRKAFGGLMANNEIHFSIKEGEIVAIIGPNGSGKTTFYNLLTGISPATSGSITFKGKDITRCKPEEITKMGISRTFQNIRLFKALSVLDNVKVGLHNDYKYSTISGIFRLPPYFKVEKQMNERAMELLKVFDLDGEAETLAANLPYGKQRKLEIARALATNPKLLLLDEPAAGINPNETAELMETI